MMKLTTQQKISLAFTVAVGASIAIGFLSYMSVAHLRTDAACVAHTQEVIGALEKALSIATDAETAGRGYAITGRDALAPGRGTWRFYGAEEGSNAVSTSLRVTASGPRSSRTSRQPQKPVFPVM